MAHGTKNLAWKGAKGGGGGWESRPVEKGGKSSDDFGSHNSSEKRTESDGEALSLRIR